MDDSVGHLVEFIEKNRVNLALVLATKNRRLNLLTPTGKEITAPLSRVLTSSPAKVGPGQSRQAQTEYMQRVEREREELAAEVDVPFVWELVREEAEPLPLKDLAAMAFTGQVGDDHVSATLRALFQDHLHFRLAGGEFLPLTPEQLEQKRVQEEQEAEQRRKVDEAVDYLRSVRQTGKRPDTSAPPGLLEMLADLVVFEDDAREAKYAKQIVSLAELGGRRQVHDLLVRLGHFQPHENLPLLKEGLSRDFVGEVLREAAALDPAAALKPGREDLTGLYTFTIDGAYTTDFDDALSFEPDGAGGGVLGIHITDASALLPQDTLLDREAMDRGSSLYLADARIPMLPPALSEDSLSLREGLERPAVSTLLTLDAGGRVLDYRLTRSLIRVDRRLTYDETDGLLETDQRLAGLHRVCQAFRRIRHDEMGAYFLPLPEVLVYVDEEHNVSVRRVDRDGPSREMVAETAILANWMAGRFLQEKNIPALYRLQPGPSKPLEEGDPGDIYLHFSQRRLLNPVELTTKPGLHSSLGVEPYTHSTSPIRRYLDLAVQRQLTSVLETGKPLYTEEELRELATYVEPNVRRGNRVRQIRQRYWLIRWLEERMDTPLPAVVMEQQYRRWQLVLTDIMMLAGIPLDKAPPLTPGQKVEVRVVKADAFHDVLRIKLA